MSGFFDGTRPGEKVEYQGREFELPALYFRDDCFILFFSADYQAILDMMPSDKLHPVRLHNGKAAVGVAAYNYIETTIGPYGEIAVAIPVVHGHGAPFRLIPMLRESNHEGFGMLVAHLPVTNMLARDGGRLGWNYPKFIADMKFTITPDFMEVNMKEDDALILEMRVMRKGFFRTDKKPLTTYTVQDGDLVKTVVPQTGSYRMAIKPKGSYLNLGHHPVAQQIRSWGISSEPIMSRYYVERAGILPLGTTVEKDVRPFDGYRGQDREGLHEVKYLP